MPLFKNALMFSTISRSGSRPEMAHLAIVSIVSSRFCSGVRTRSGCSVAPGDGMLRFQGSFKTASRDGWSFDFNGCAGQGAEMPPWWSTGATWTAMATRSWTATGPHLGRDIDSILMGPAAYETYEPFGTELDQTGRLLQAGNPRPVEWLRVEERVVYLRLLDPQHTGPAASNRKGSPSPGHWKKSSWSAGGLIGVKSPGTRRKLDVEERQAKAIAPRLADALAPELPYSDNGRLL